MTIFGNILLGLAAFFYVLPLQLMLNETPRKNDGGLIWAAIFVLVPLWIFLTSATCVATAKGALDWTGRERSTQYLLVIVAGLALMVATGFGLIYKFDPPAQMPAITRALAGWAVQIFPLVALAFVALALNPGLAKSVPPSLVRIPVMVVAGLSLVTTAGLLVQWAVFSAKQSAVRVEAEVEFHNKRDRDILARVEVLKTDEGFVELLGFANRFEKENIRTLAVAKVQAHPAFTAALTDVLTGDWAEKGLVYLDACDAPDPQALAAPVRAAILTLAGDARESVAKTHTFYAAQFDWNTRLILSVADKFGALGVDYVPAVREFRAALDAPRGKDFDFTARRPLDAWLAKRGGR